MSGRSVSVVIELRAKRKADLVEVLSEARPRLERALVARFGVDDGLEAAAEALAYAVHHRARLMVMSNPVGYLYRVGETRGRRLARRWQRLEALVSDPLTTDRVIDVDLQGALMQLTPDKRVAVMLVDAHGHTYREAAEILGVPVTTVTNHVQRGRKRLRRILERRA